MMKNSKGSNNHQLHQQQQNSTYPKQAVQMENVNSVANQVFRLALFDHLPRKQNPKDPDSIESDRLIHASTIQLGLMYHRGILQADDDRVQALIASFVCMITEYKTPQNKILREDLDRYIGKQVNHLVECRQISKSMGNVVKYLKQCISKISPESSEADAKLFLLEKLHSFVDEKIIFAGESIASYVANIINDDDVILTFGSSPLVRKILVHAASKKKFRLIVIDTRPLNDGLLTVAALSGMKTLGICYSPLSGAAVALKDATKVILGASCLLSNGSMLAAAGTAMVASLARDRHVPVIVASESYKFSDKVQLDSIVFNELGHPSEIVTLNDEQASDATLLTPQLEIGYRGAADKLSYSLIGHSDVTEGSDLVSTPSQRISVVGSKLPFEVVNLRYDITPLSNISVVATETGLLPPTSIPVLIREIQNDLSLFNHK